MEYVQPPNTELNIPAKWHCIILVHQVIDNLMCGRSLLNCWYMKAIVYSPYWRVFIVLTITRKLIDKMIYQLFDVSRTVYVTGVVVVEAKVCRGLVFYSTFSSLRQKLHMLIFEKN